jgi:DNA-binding NarL/FixJ family response regulator
MTKRVLIADDNELMRRTIRSFLEQRDDIEVCAQTVNGIETVKTAMALRPDLLILDVVMPGLNGIEVAGILNKSLPQSKILLFTMYADSVGEKLASATGVNIVLQKSKGLSGLAETLDSLLDSAGSGSLGESV